MIYRWPLLDALPPRVVFSNPPLSLLRAHFVWADRLGEGGRNARARMLGGGDDGVVIREAAAAIFVELDEVEGGKGGRGAHVEECSILAPSPKRKRLFCVRLRETRPFIQR